jgi:hypothetical protein
MGLPFVPWHSAPLERQSCQLSAPAALTSNEISSYYSSFGGWVDPRTMNADRKIGQWKISKTFPGIETANISSCGDTVLPSLYTKRHVEHHHVALSVVNGKLHNTNIPLQLTYIHSVGNMKVMLKTWVNIIII